MTNVFDPETWGSQGGPDTLGGHFFHFFFGVGSGSEPVPGPGHPGRGEGVILDRGIAVRDRDPGIDRERIRGDSSSIVITIIVSTRSHSDR